MFLRGENLVGKLFSKMFSRNLWFYNVNPFVNDNTFVQRYCHLQRDLHCKITDFERFYFENNFPTRFSPRRNNIFHSFLFFHLRLYFYYPKKHKSDHNNKKRKSKFRVIESWQKKKEQYQLFGTIKENNCYVLDTEVGVSGGGVAVTTRSSFCVR